MLDAAARGTRDGLHLALNIAAMLIAFVGLVALINKGLSLAGTDLQTILGWAMSPVAYLIGVPWQDVKEVGKLLGTRTVLNEVFAYIDLGKARDAGLLMDRSVVICSFALCGFANISSIGIQLGGIGALRRRAPSRPGAAGREGALRRHPGELPLRLHRGSLAMTAHPANTDLYSRAEEAAAAIRAVSVEPPRIGVVLGSGLNELADRLSEPLTIPYRADPPLPPHHGRRTRRESRHRRAAGRPAC